MTTIRAEDVRIPRQAREAVARHEHVTVMNRERPAFVVVHPDDTTAGQPPTRRGRRLGEALGLLANAALPDPGFADDMEAVLGEVGRALRMILDTTVFIELGASRPTPAPRERDDRGLRAARRTTRTDRGGRDRRNHRL